MKTSTTTATGPRRLWRLRPLAVSVASTLAGGALVAAVILPVAWYLGERGDQVESGQDVGTPVAVQSFPNDWTGSRMNVETQLGWFQVGGSMPISKQLPMTLETRASGDQWLCQDSPKRCARLLAPAASK